MRLILIICGIVVLLLAGLYILGGIAGKRELQKIKPWITYTRLMGIAEGCDKYKAQYDSWPSSLSQLQKGHPELVDPWDKDGWGRELVLVPYNETRGYGEIISYGRDAKPGGTGDNRDLEVRFPTDANADWNKQEGVGLKEP